MLRNFIVSSMESVTAWQAWQQNGWGGLLPGPAPHFIIFSRKKVAICLGIWWELCNFAAVIKKNGKEMNFQNLLGNLIFIRLRKVVGSEKVCI